MIHLSCQHADNGLLQCRKNLSVANSECLGAVLIGAVKNPAVIQGADADVLAFSD